MPEVTETTIQLHRVRVLAQPKLQIAVVLVNLIVGLAMGLLLAGKPSLRLTFALGGAVWGGAVGIAAARKLGRAGAPLSIAIDDSYVRIELPHELLELRLEELRSIEEGNKRRVLIISTDRRRFVFPFVAFGDDIVQHLRQTVRAALAIRPNGRQLVAAMGRREELGRLLMHRRLIVVWVLVGGIFLGFAAELGQGALTAPAALLSLGGNASTLVADGQWWRLFTANFLHASWLHLGFNYIALVVIGALLERLIGPWEMLSVSLASGVVANVASALASTHVFSVGISGIVFA